MITLASDGFKVEYIIADFKAAFDAELQFYTHFFLSDEVFLRFKLLLEIYRTVS